MTSLRGNSYYAFVSATTVPFVSLAAAAFVPPDYHIHTVLCKHAEGLASEYRAAAARCGMRSMAFTDHVPTPVGYDPANRMDLDQFPLYRDMVLQFRNAGEPHVLLGVEADYHPGCETYLRDWLPRQEFDLVLGSVHYIREWGFDNPAERDRWDTADLRRAWQDYCDLLAAMAQTGLFDIVGHLDLPKKFGHRLPDKDLRELAQPLLDSIARADMTIEINTAGLRKPVGEMYPSPLLLALAHERGIPICFGSDAHRPHEVGAAFGAAVRLAQSVGYAAYAQYRQRGRTLHPWPAAQAESIREPTDETDAAGKTGGGPPAPVTMLGADGARRPRRARVSDRL